MNTDDNDDDEVSDQQQSKRPRAQQRRQAALDIVFGRTLDSLPRLSTIAELSKLDYEDIGALCVASPLFQYVYCGDTVSGSGGLTELIVANRVKRTDELWLMLLRRDFGIARTTAECRSPLPEMRVAIAASMERLFPSSVERNQDPGQIQKLAAVYRKLRHWRVFHGNWLLRASVHGTEFFSDLTIMGSTVFLSRTVSGGATEVHVLPLLDLLLPTNTADLPELKANDFAFEQVYDERRARAKIDAISDRVAETPRKIVFTRTTGWQPRRVTVLPRRRFGLTIDVADEFWIYNGDDRLDDDAEWPRARLIEEDVFGGHWIRTAAAIPRSFPREASMVPRTDRASKETYFDFAAPPRNRPFIGYISTDNTDNPAIYLNNDITLLMTRDVPVGAAEDYQDDSFQEPEFDNVFSADYEFVSFVQNDNDDGSFDDRATLVLLYRNDAVDQRMVDKFDDPEYYEGTNLGPFLDELSGQRNALVIHYQPRDPNFVFANFGTVRLDAPDLTFSAAIVLRYVNIRGHSLFHFFHVRYEPRTQELVVVARYKLLVNERNRVGHADMRLIGGVGTFIAVFGGSAVWVDLYARKFKLQPRLVDFYETGPLVADRYLSNFLQMTDRRYVYGTLTPEAD